MSDDYAAAIIAATSGMDLHDLAERIANDDTVDNDRRYRLQMIYATRVHQLWPRLLRRGKAA